MSGGNPLILVVDDDGDLRTLITDFLRANGLRVESAADGAEMDARIAAERPDLIVLDLMMPGEDGLSILRRVRKPGGPAVIMLSAMGEDTDRIIGLEVGADDYLPKPCNPRELLARIRAVLRRRGEEAAAAGTGGAVRRFGPWTLDIVQRIKAFARMAGVALGGNALTAHIGVERLRLDFKTLERLCAADPDTRHGHTFDVHHDKTPRIRRFIVKIDSALHPMPICPALTCAIYLY